MEELNKTFDVIIPVKSTDLDNIQAVIKNVKRFIVGAKNIIIITNTKKLDENIPEIHNNDVQILDENKIIDGLSFTAVKNAIAQYHGDQSSSGWYLQQFIKLGYSEICKDDYYLVWDADTVPLREIGFFDESGRPIFDLKREYHWQYFASIAKLFPELNKEINLSYISEHMLFDKRVCEDMLDRIKSNEALEGESFWERILSACKLIGHPRSFSEFELFGTFCHHYHPGLYSFRKLSTLRPAALYFGTPDEKGLEKLGHDFDTISIECTDLEATKRVAMVAKNLVSLISPLKAIHLTNKVFASLSKLPISFLKNDHNRILERSEFDFCFNEKSIYESMKHTSKSAESNKRIFIDLSGNIAFSKDHTHVSGVERVVANLSKSLLEGEIDVHFLFFNHDDNKWYKISGLKPTHFDSLEIFAKVGNDRHIFRRTKRGLKDALFNKPKYKWPFAYLKYLSDRSRYPHREHKAYFENGAVCVQRFETNEINDSDIFCICHWVNHAFSYNPFIDDWKQRGGRVAFFFHDIIPITETHFVSRAATENFGEYYTSKLRPALV